MKYHFLIIAIMLFNLSCLEKYQFEKIDATGMKWFRGNTHAHTTNSDGDAPPDIVAGWYKDHGYQFLAITDHDTITEPSSLIQQIDSTFILIRAEEVSASNTNEVNKMRKKPIHLNALCPEHIVKPQLDTTMTGIIQKNIDAIRHVNGIPHLNHPNYKWSIKDSEIIPVNGLHLFEIYNGHPGVNNFSAGGELGTEELWDMLLTSGLRIYGIATDDAHSFTGEFSRQEANPGRGWVVVRALSLNADEIVHNLEKGLFYASNGVELEDIIVKPKSLEVYIHEQSDYKYSTEFIGNHGEILQKTIDNPAIYNLSENTKYVRAKVYCSTGYFAWVQPVFVQKTPR